MHDAPRDIHFKQSRQATYRNACNWAYFKKHWLCQKLEDLTLSDRKQMKTNHLRIIMKLGKNKSPLLIILIFIWTLYLFIYLFIYLLSLSYLFLLFDRFVSCRASSPPRRRRTAIISGRTGGTSSKQIRRRPRKMVQLSSTRAMSRSM